MRRRTIHDLKSSRQTARYITSANAEAEALRKAYETLYGHMMIQDVSLGVMPVGGRSTGRSTRAGFAVVLDPGDAKVERLIIDGLDGITRTALRSSFSSSSTSPQRGRRPLDARVYRCISDTGSGPFLIPQE